LLTMLRYTPEVDLVIYTKPEVTGTYSFKGVCPGTDACDKNMDIDPLLVPNQDYTVCLYPPPSTPSPAFNLNNLTACCPLPLCVPLFFIDVLSHAVICEAVNRRRRGLCVSVSWFTSHAGHLAVFRQRQPPPAPILMLRRYCGAHRSRLHNFIRRASFAIIVLQHSVRSVCEILSVAWRSASALNLAYRHMPSASCAAQVGSSSPRCSGNSAASPPTTACSPLRCSL
jgi:hypothetical protein